MHSVVDVILHYATRETLIGVSVILNMEQERCAEPRGKGGFHLQQINIRTIVEPG